MKCPNCGIELLGGMKVCPRCKYDTSLGIISPDYIKKQDIGKEERESLEEQNNRILNFIATTSGFVDGYRISKYIAIKSGQCVLGTGFLSDLSAGVNDMLGTESNRMGDKLSQVKDVALRKLIAECVKVHADAVIGVDTDVMTVGHNMMVASATGTAVKLEKI